MKNIYRFFVSALVLFAFTVACNPPEINEPDNPSNPEQTGYTITASIVQTRVSYDDSTDGEKLEQKWEENDILFGFYGKEISKKIIFKVSSVNGGVATLDPVDGWEGEDGLGKAADGTEVNLVYTGANYNSIEEFDFSKGLFVDMSSQTIGRIPACMHSKASLEEDNGNKSIDFKFINDCAIIEISGLSGIKEQVTGSSTISSIAVTNLLLEGTYSYQIDEDSGKGELVFVGGENTTSSHSITLGDGWSVDEDGFINNTDGNLLLIAAAPNSDAKEINVTAAISGMGSYTYSYGDKSLQAGNCYVINAAPIVAKVKQGSSPEVLFATVYEAFNYAEGLESTDGDITVTLLKDCGLGRHIAPGDVIDPLTVVIFYKVSFDLNGHVLTLSGDYQEDDNEDTTYDKSECFNVYSDDETRGELTIKDSSPYQTGAIISESNTHLIKNSGDVIINGGTVKHNADWSAVRNYEGAVLTVNGGELYSDSWRTIHDEGGTVIVNDGKVSSRTSSAIYSDEEGTVEISGGFISNASEIYEAIQIYGGAQCTISGGVIFSENTSTIFCGSVDKGDDASDASVLTITWPEKRNDEGEIEYDQTSGVANHEPLIYSKSSGYYSIAPITTYLRNEGGITRNNTAQVLIQGGYLFTHNSEGIIYVDDDVNINAFTNLQFSSCGKFYANASVIDIYANSYNKKYFKDLMSYSYDNKQFDLTPEDPFTPDFVSGLPTETSLYYIE